MLSETQFHNHYYHPGLLPPAIRRMGEGNSFSLFTSGGGGVCVCVVVTPSKVQGGGGCLTPPPGIASTFYGYAAGGMPLAFTQEDFLVALIISRR